MIQNIGGPRKNSGFGSAHCFSHATNLSSSNSASWAWLRNRSALPVIAAVLMFSTGSFAESGADAYKAHCSACHGAKGAGDTMLGRNLKLRALGSDEVQKQSDDELFTIISTGKNRMPAFDRKLSKDQIRDVLKYVRSLSK